MRAPAELSLPAGRHQHGSLLADLAGRVRRRPVVGYAPDWDGTRTRVRLDENALAWIASATYYYPGLYRDLPAALLAARRGYSKPILRLAAETVTIDVGGEDPPHSSEALYLAVICHDYPQLWDPGTPMGERRAEARQRIVAYPPGSFHPFSSRALDQHRVRGRPSLPALALAGATGPARSARRDVPGRADSRPERRSGTITASSGARVVANRFPSSTFVELLPCDRDPRPRRLRVQALHSFPSQAHGGKHGLRTTDRRRAPSPAFLAPGSGSARGESLPGGPVKGARPATRGGGRGNRHRRGCPVVGQLRRHERRPTRRRLVVLGEGPIVFRLRGVRLVPRVPVSGIARWYPRKGNVRAEVSVRGPRGLSGSVRIRWSTHAQLGQARLRGRIGGRLLRTTILAP